MNTRIAITGATALLALSACTWVKHTEEGSRVVLAEPVHVAHCEKLGTTTTAVKHEVGRVQRDDEKVAEELTTLARNEAAVMGGDTIVSLGPPRDGSAKFEVYRCR